MNLADAHNNLGVTLMELGCPEDALRAFDAAVSLQPDDTEAQNNRGTALAALGEFEAALAASGKAVALSPGDANAWTNRGHALQHLGRYEEAVLAYDQAIASRPGHAAADWTRSLCQLAMGDYKQGWRNFEWRWRTQAAASSRGLPGAPWLGDFPIDNKTILVRAEQGFGDSLQFCRYVPLLAARATIVLETPRRLARLLSTLDGVSEIIVRGEKSPPFDAWTPMMSLPLAFRTTLATIPAAVPYLHADPERSADWKQRLSAFPGRKIGLVGLARAGRTTRSRAPSTGGVPSRSSTSRRSRRSRGFA